MKTIIIKKNDTGIRLDKFIKKVFPNLSKTLIYKFIRTKKIKVNNKKIDINYITVENDVISYYFAYEEDINLKNNDYDFCYASNQLEIIYEDINIIIVNKPIKLSVYDEKNKDTLINRVLKYLYFKKEYIPNIEAQFKPSLGHRIDTNTSGLVIIAKNMQALQEINHIFKNNLIIKNYLALLHGQLKLTNGTIKCYIKKCDSLNMVKVSSYQIDNTYKESITNYNVINNAISNKYTLVDIELITGRTHQIRASFNYIGYPLVGEQKYISKNIDKDLRFKYQCLCSYKLKFKNNNLKTLSYLSNQEFLIKKKPWFLSHIK